MTDFAKSIKIQASHVTPFRKLRASSLLSLLQEISIEHTENLGFPRETTLDKGLLWVIAKQHIEITRMPKYDETVTILTYPSEMMHALFPRSYEVKDNKGNTIIKGLAIWTLIDIKSRMMINPKEYGVIIPDLSNGRDFSIPLGHKMPLDLSNETSLKASYSLCDINGHINNSSYLDIAEDLIPVSYIEKHDLKAIDIEYVHEVKLGEELNIKYGQKDDTFYFLSPAFKLRLDY